MIFKMLAENEQHSNLLLIAQNMTIDKKNSFPEKFLFYMFSKYYPFALNLEFRNKKTIPIRSRIDGKLNEIAMLEYMTNGETVIIADEMMFEPGKIKNISDILMKDTGFDHFNNSNKSKQFLNIPFFGDLEYHVYAQKAYPYGGDVELRFYRYNTINEWTLTIKILLGYIHQTKIQLSEENINSLKILLSDILMIDIQNEKNSSFVNNIENYNRLLEMIQI